MRTAGIALLILCLAGCASGPGLRGGRDAADRPDGQAQGGMLLNPAGLMIAGCDSDGDYRVTRAELDAGIARGFAVADGDGDGALSPLEFTAWRELAFGAPTALPGPYSFDADQDGTITAAEFAAEIRRQAAEYQGEDGAIAFAALTREADFARGGFGRGVREFRLEPTGGPGGPGGQPY